jgi:hypothetical protein
VCVLLMRRWERLWEGELLFVMPSSYFFLVRAWSVFVDCFGARSLSTKHTSSTLCAMICDWGLNSSLNPELLHHQRPSSSVARVSD